jgi:hypothetical protein
MLDLYDAQYLICDLYKNNFSFSKRRPHVLDPHVYPRISQRRIRPCSLATASWSEPGETATDEIRPRGVLDVGQLRYTVQEGRWTVQCQSVSKVDPEVIGMEAYPVSMRPASTD